METGPTSRALGEQPSHSSSNDSAISANHTTPTHNEHMGRNNQINTFSQSTPSLLSNPEPTITPAPALVQEVPQTIDMDSSIESFIIDTNAITRRVHFRSTAEIVTYVVQTPIGTPPCSPRTIRRKLRRRRLFLSHEIDISCGHSTPESREGDAVEDLYEGKYSTSDDFRRWRQQQDEEAKRRLHLRQISQLKRSNTYPYLTDRSISKETACGYYRISPSAYEVMNRLAPMPRQVGPVRTTRPLLSLAHPSANMDFDGRNIRHPREDLTLSEITGMLTEASIQPSPWWDVGPQPLDSRVSETHPPSSGVVSASISALSTSSGASNSTSSFAAFPAMGSSTPASSTTSTSTKAPFGTPKTQRVFHYIPVSFPQGAPPSISSLYPASFSEGVQISSFNHSTCDSHPSNPSSSRPKHRSTPTLSKQSRQPSPAEMTQMSDTAREAYLSVAAIEVGITPRKNNGPTESGNWIKTITNLVRPMPQLEAASRGGGDGNGIGPGSRSMRSRSSPSSSRPLRLTPTSSSSRLNANPSSISQSVSRQSGSIPLSNHHTSRPSVLGKKGNQLASQFRDPSGLAIARRITANSIPSVMQLQSISATISQFPNSQREVNQTGSSKLHISQSSSSGHCGDEYDSSTLLSSGPPRSSWLTSAESDDTSNSYLPPLSVAMSPILPSVLSASDGIVASSSLATKEDIMVNNASQLSSQLFNIPSGTSRQVDLDAKLPGVPSNAPWEVNAKQRNASGHRNENDGEGIGDGKQTDKAIRSSTQFCHEDQDFEDENHYLQDDGFEEEYFIEDDENEDEIEEGEGEGAEVNDDAATGWENDNQALIGHEKNKKKKKTLLQRVKKGFSFLKSKKTPPTV